MEKYIHGTYEDLSTNATGKKQKEFSSFSVRIDKVEKKVSIIADQYSRLSEKIVRLENMTKIEIPTPEDSEDLNISLMRSSYITDLLSNINFPGMHYVAEGRWPKVHTLFWIFIHTAALLSSMTYIEDEYYRWQNSPIVQSLTLTKAKDIPFPAVTLCEPTLLKEEYNRFEILKRCMSLENEKHWLCSEEELNMFRVSLDILHISFDMLSLNESDRDVLKTLFRPIIDPTAHCFPGDLNRTFSEMEYLKYMKKLGKEHVSRIEIYNLDFPGNHYYSHSMFNNGSLSRTILLSPNSNAKGGFWKCHTFNGIIHRPQVQKGKIATKKVSNSGFSKSLVCNTQTMLNNVCKSNLLYTEHFLDIEIEDEIGIDINESASLFPKVYIVFIHNPVDYPSGTNMNVYKLPKHYFTTFTSTPKLINADKGIMSVEVSKRDCVFPFEKNLSLFEVYTYQNCILECQINCSLATCGCVPYNIGVFSSFNICSNYKSKVCNSISSFFFWKDYKDDRCPCDCPPECVSLSYENEIKSQETTTRTTFRVKYKEDKFLSTFRHSVNSPAQFVAYSLGILGVFNGFSIILVWEILYWLTLRLWSTIGRSLRATPEN